MKKTILTALCLLISAGIAKGAGNHLSIHYNNTSYRFSGYDGAKDNNFSLNGIGIAYDYMWIPPTFVEEDIPFFIGEGLNINFDLGSPKFGDGEGNSMKVDVQDLNIQLPVNFGYIFNVNDGAFLISPYAGINFKYHILTRAKFKGNDSDWLSFYSEDDMGEDGKWKRFQMGWQAGVDFSFNAPVFLRVQYGTDFLPNYSYKEEGYKEKVNSGNLRVTLGYYF